MAIDPNIALGVRGIELQNPLNALAQYSQIQNAQNQNAMAQLQMREAEAAAQEKNMLRRLDPTAADYESQLFRVSPQLGINYRKEQAATEASKAATTSSLATAAKAKQQLLGQALRDISGRPSDANITAHTEDIQASSLFSPEEKAKALVTQQTLLSIPFEQRQAYLASQGATPSELKPTLTSQDFGGGKRVISTPAFGGMATLVPGSEIAKTQTFADITAAKQAATSAGQLNLAQQKFAFEQANPGFELKEAEDGSIVGVNKRTLQAFPVNVGGVAPTATPTTAPMAGAGMPSARLPSPANQAIPGMTSVLDQPALATAAAVPAVGTLLRGKGTAPIEGERKAATLLQRLQGSQNQLTQALLDDPKAAGPQAFATAVGKLSTTAANLFNTEARQRVEAAQLDILDAALTLGTGAAYTKEQLEAYRQAYFPAYGDEPKTIADKQARLQNVINAANIAAGKAAKLVPKPPSLKLPNARGGVDTSNPLLSQ